MKVKKVLVLLIAIAISLSLVACGNKQGSVVSSDSKDGGLSGKIVVWSYKADCKSLQATAEDFKKKYPKVKLEFVDLESEQIYDKMTTGLASNAELPDVVSVEGEHVSTFINKFPKGFIDLTNEVSKNDFLPMKIAECTVNGKVMAFPREEIPCAIFYRKDLFDKAELKAEDIITWDDYIEAGKKLDSIGIKMIPINLSKGDDMYRQFMNQLGTFYFDKDGKTVLNGDESIKAMTLIRKMNDAKIVYDNVDWNDLITATKEGKIASIPSGAFLAGVLQDQCSEFNGKWAVMKFPAFEAGGKTAASFGGSNFMVTEASKNKKVAIAFAKFAATDKESIIRGFKDFGLYPSYIPCYSDAIFDEKVKYFGEQQIWKLFLEISKEIPPMNFTENFAETKSSVIDAQAKIIFKGADVKTTMSELQKNISGKLGK